MILLQIVIVSPGIHLVKNHESQLKKQGAMLGPLCNQTVNPGGRCQNTLFQSLKLNIVHLYI